MRLASADPDAGTRASTPATSTDPSDMCTTNSRSSCRHERSVSAPAFAPCVTTELFPGSADPKRRRLSRISATDGLHLLPSGRHMQDRNQRDIGGRPCAQGSRNRKPSHCRRIGDAVDRLREHQRRGAGHRRTRSQPTYVEPMTSGQSTERLLELPSPPANTSPPAIPIREKCQLQTAIEKGTLKCLAPPPPGQPPRRPAPNYRSSHFHRSAC